MQPTEVAESELRLKADQAIKEMNSLTTAAKGFATQLEDVLKHLDAINNKSFSKVKKQINKYDLGSASNIAIGTAGTMASQSGRGKVFREYEQAMVDQTNAQTELTKEIKRDTAQRRKLRKQNADTEKQRVSKMEDKASPTYISNKTKLADADLLKAQARMLNAQNSGAGALNKNWKYQTGRGLQTLGQTVSGLGTGGRLVGLGLDTAGAMLKAPALGAATAITNLAKGISDLGKQAIQAFSEIESIKTQLGVVFSNQTQANSMFGEISQYAVRSPFGVQQTSELAVLLKQSGVYATDLMDTLRMIGDTAGGNMEKMKRIANNYAQIVSIGKASMLDMRQFAYAGIPIFEAVSKELGVSQQELRKLISDGKVTSDIIEKVFKDLTGINGIFENATEKGAKTLKARLQNLSDAKQLAFAQGGQWLTGLGTQTGNDSYVNRMVSWTENLYSKLNDWFGKGNIAADVATIARRNDRIKQLEDLIAINKGNEETLKYLQSALERELAKIDVDVQRATYESSYNEKKTQYDDVRKIFGNLSLKEAQSRYWNMQDWYSTGYTDRFYLKNDERYKNFSMLDDETLQEQMSLLKEFIQALRDEQKITTEELQAHKESNIINAQQLEFDRANKAADREGSYAAGFEKLYGLYTSSDEYKAEQQKKETEWLEESKKVLKELLTYKNEAGNIDITKMTYEKLNEYLDEEKRVLGSGRKLTIVEGKSQATMTADRAVLTQQYRDIYTKIEGELLDRGDFFARNELGRLNRGINYSADNKTFFREFSRTLDDELSIFDGLIENAKNDRDKEDYKNLRRALLSSTFLYEAPSEKGVNANTSGNNSLPVPLWKRILAGATGLSTQGMTGTIQTMQNYRDDMAIRNMTSSVLSATMKSMGIDSAMGLVKTAGNQKILRGDTGATFQVDWQATRKAIKEFSLSLSASTEVVTAYKNSLQQELDTYEQLIAAGYTQGESQDLKNQKTVSTKTLAKLSQDAGDQLVNAFGEGLKTASGKTAFFNGTDFVDSEGNKLQEEEIIMTGNLFEFIKGELPRIYNELHEANVAELNNSVLNKMLDNINATQLWGKYLQNGYDSNAIQFLQNNSDYAKNYINSALTTKNSKGTIWTKGLSNEMILANAYRYAGQETKDLYLNRIRNASSKEERDSLESELHALEESSRLLTKVFEEMGVDINKFISSDLYKDLFEKNYTKDRDDAVRAAYLRNMQINENGLTDMNSLRPRDYGGIRGMRNWMQELFTGESLAYDKEDFIAETLKNNKEFVNKVNNKRVQDWINGGYKNGALELLPENAAELGKTNGELANMLSLSEQIMITWDKGANDIAKRMDDLAHSIGQALSQFTSSAITSTFETWGDALGKGADASEAIGENSKKLGANLLSNLGTMITEAGLSMAISSAGNLPMVLAGLGLAAAGGAASWLGGFLNAEKDSKDSTKDETAKLESLKKDLQDLLSQARTDALYYENNLRHKNALGINRQFSEKSVHDAVITPKGDVVTTDPKDYLIATKQPQNLVGGGNVTVQPIINCNVVNNSSARVRQEQTQNADGSIDILTIIEDTVGQYIASSKSDAAFEARDYRRNGRQAVM